MAHGLDVLVAGESAVGVWICQMHGKWEPYWFQTCYPEVPHLVVYAYVEGYKCKTVLHYNLLPKRTLFLWQFFHEESEGCERGCRMC